MVDARRGIADHAFEAGDQATSSGRPARVGTDELGNPTARRAPVRGEVVAERQEARPPEVRGAGRVGPHVDRLGSIARAVP